MGHGACLYFESCKTYGANLWDSGVSEGGMDDADLFGCERPVLGVLSHPGLA